MTPDQACLFIRAIADSPKTNSCYQGITGKTFLANGRRYASKDIERKHAEIEVFLKELAEGYGEWRKIHDAEPSS